MEHKGSSWVTWLLVIISQAFTVLKKGKETRPGRFWSVCNLICMKNSWVIHTGIRVEEPFSVLYEYGIDEQLSVLYGYEVE